MSQERNYRCYVQKYHDVITEDGKVDLEALSIKLELHHISEDEAAALGELRIRAMISERLGAYEEALHKTSKDEDTGVRRNSVPGHTTEHHNRLVEDLWHFLTPPEPPVRRVAQPPRKAPAPLG